MRRAAILLVTVCTALAVTVGLREVAGARGAAPPAGTVPPPGAQCAETPAPGSTSYHVRYGGRVRSYVLHVPPKVASGTTLPLVLALHGAGGSGPKMESYSGLDPVADRHGFAVAYPNAASPVWNITAARSDADDVGYLASVVDDVERTICVDSDRVFATGVSNGAGMVALLACRLSTVISAVVPVEGVYDGQPACRPAQPVSVLEIHGTADRVAPYSGLRARAAQGPPPFITAWARRDGCAAAPAGRGLAVRTVLLTWRGCAGVTVEHIRIAGGAHQWPGATPPDPGPPATICTACAVWSFLRALPPRLAAQSGGAGF